MPLDNYDNLGSLVEPERVHKACYADEQIFEKELENNTNLKNYYDNWGNRVYAFYNDQDNLMLNFQHAKKLGADYIISGFPIKNDELKIVCYKCNNSKNLFLYKIL